MMTLMLVEVDANFNLEKAVCNHGFFMMAPNRWIPREKSLSRPLRLLDQTTSVTVSINQPSNQQFLLVKVLHSRQLSSRDKQTVRVRKQLVLQKPSMFIVLYIMLFVRTRAKLYIYIYLLIVRIRWRVCCEYRLKTRRWCGNCIRSIHERERLVLVVYSVLQPYLRTLSSQSYFVIRRKYARIILHSTYIFIN